MSITTSPPLMIRQLNYDPNVANFTLPRGTRRLTFVDGGNVAFEGANGTLVVYENVPAWHVMDDFKPVRSLTEGSVDQKIIVHYTQEV